MTWTKACAATLAAGECVGLQVGGVEVAVYNVDGSFHATSNLCTHQHAYLSDGWLEGEMIECPLHQGRFNVRTGAAEGPPLPADLKVFPIRIEDGQVYVEID
jgi:naphthalene 1,2-dioxygenase system ferredoxin subunit